MISIIAILGTIILMFSIPLILRIRNYLYDKHGYKKAWYEDYAFVIGLLTCLLIHCMITGSELTGCLTIAPFTYINFQLYKYFWKKY